jgi:1-deoxy-D-xylulose-5-phosphate synthase
VGITPAMREGSGMVEFHKRFPDATTTWASPSSMRSPLPPAGLRGLKPVVAIYSTFLQRAYDQLIHDVALQNLPSCLRWTAPAWWAPTAPPTPGLRHRLPALHSQHGAWPARPMSANAASCCPPRSRRTTPWPCATRAAPAPAWPPSRAWRPCRLAREKSAECARVDRTGPAGIAILAFGTLLYPALQAAEKLGATVVNMRWAKPLDVELLLKVAAEHEALVTVEEGAVMGGAGSAVAEALAGGRDRHAGAATGLPDVFIEHGDPAACWRCRGWSRCLNSCKRQPLAVGPESFSRMA